MTDKEFADFLFPEVKEIAYYEEKYGSRNLPDGAVVTRCAPSPTGFVHMGSLYQGFIAKQMARQSGGVLFLRIEDTDQKREVENGVEGIVKDFKEYGITFDEGYGMDGDYGPYIQSERGEIYKAYVKYLVEKGYAYPCFCTPEEIDENRKIQEATKERIGYYGRWSTCRGLTKEEAVEKIKSGKPFIMRMKSQGDFRVKHIYHDLIKGDLEYPENDLDHVILKSDGLPTYHFAHAVDDHLMHTTHVIRGDEWVSSLPVHLELFHLLGFEPPKYAHIAPLTKKDEETGNIRKLSKRKDPELAVSYYHEAGIPVGAVNLFLATIANSSFEEWYLQNQDKSYTDFTFTFDKMPIGGSLFDLEKLESVSKIYFSKLSAKQVYEETLNYAKEYDASFAEILEKYKDYTISLLNIEREIERPRKDIGSYKDVKKEFWYMYDELFFTKENPYSEVEKTYPKEDLQAYFEEVYDASDSEEEWFSKIKTFAEAHGYAVNRKLYKENPENFKGQVGDFCEMIRVMATTKTISPNLYDILQLLGKERLQKRLALFMK